MLAPTPSSPFLTYFYLIIGVAIVIYVIYDIWAKQESMSTSLKVTWTIVVILLNALGAVIYYFLVKKE